MLVLVISWIMVKSEKEGNGNRSMEQMRNLILNLREIRCPSCLLSICTLSNTATNGMKVRIVRRSPPRRSPPQTFTTSDVHHPLCKIRRSPPQTFTTSDVHHLRRSPPQTFTTSDIHHPQCKIRRSPPQTFTTPDVHHLRRSPPQTFTTPFVKSDVHHPLF